MPWQRLGHGLEKPGIQCIGSNLARLSPLQRLTVLKGLIPAIGGGDRSGRQPVIIMTLSFTYTKATLPLRKDPP